MVIDKTIGGTWNNSSTEIDDLSYYLYLNNIKKISGNILSSRIYLYDQTSFIFTYYNNNSYVFKRWYDESKIILRTKKINKILSRGNR